MPASTRTSNKDANFKIYYSKKIPKQKYFPHRRKTVRDITNTAQDAPERRQMQFLPDKMRSKRNPEHNENDSGSEKENVSETGPELDVGPPLAVKTNSKKRTSRVRAEQDEGDDLTVPTPKRRRTSRSATKKRTPLATVEHQPRSTTSVHARTPANTDQSHSRRRTMRRQSTMTQLVDGRRPLPEDDEPEFQPVKRTLSRSGSGGKSRKGQAKDKQQRTLTQMVAGLGSFIAPSDEDTADEAENGEGSTVYNNALAEHFANRAVSQPRAATEDAGVNTTEGPPLPTNTGPTEEYGNGDSEDAYEPTQDIQASTPRARRSSGRKHERKQSVPSAPISSPPMQRQGRFSLLATPEKRRILEIPSSQSPLEEPLSTQVTPASRHSLSIPYARTSREVQGTPSRPKRVAFAEFTTNADTRNSPKLRFTGIIQDSEDDDDLDEEDDESETEYGIGEETQAVIHGIDNALQGQDIGVETQAMLQSIDSACGERAGSARSAIQGSNISITGMTQEPGAAGPCDVEQASSGYTVEESKSSDRSKTSIQNPRSETKHKSPEEVEFARPLLLGSMRQPVTLASDDATKAPAQSEQRPDRYAQASFPIVIKDEPNEKEVEETVSLSPTPQAPLCPEISGPRLHDLNIDPPVFRHPTPRMSTTQDTAQSHSSRAEEQLQSEWLPYSQYPRRLPTSSMHVAHNGNSYQVNAFSDPVTHQLLPPQCTAPLSQATTVEGTQRSPHTTPKKSRHTSSNTTPRKVHESLPIVTPTKPPSLVIPSSFPSPSKGSWRNMSSPVLGSSPLEPYDSIEDFSIPPLPPPGSSPLFPMDDDE